MYVCLDLDLKTFQLFLHWKQELNWPQAPVLRGRSSWDDFGDEDAGIIADVRVICPSGNAEAQPRVTLWQRKAVSDNRA